MTYIATVSKADADPALAALYERVANPDGTIDAVMLMHGLSADSLSAHFELYVTAMHRSSPLSRADREMVAVVCSRLNGCRYCLVHHLSGLKRLWPEERHRVAEDLATGRVPRLDERESAMVAYATKLTTNPHDMRADDVDALRAHGLDDRAVLDLAQAVSYFAYVNRMVQGLGVELEGDRVAAGQWPEIDAAGS